MKIIFMGTPIFAKICLEALVDSGKHNILAVVTQPDRPSGRGKRPTPSPVKEFSQEMGFEILQPEKANRGDFPDKLAAFGADIFVVAAYGQILSQKILEIPKFGAINAHASLLPEFRGASPIQQAILEGETVSGITIMQMDVGMDTGDMLLTREVAINAADTGGDLHDKLCGVAGEALLSTLDEIAENRTNPIKQDDAKATYAPIITKEMTLVDFTKNPQEITDMVRAYNPTPAAFAIFGDKKFKIWSVQPVDISSDVNCGEIVKACPKDGLFVQANGGVVQIIEITPPGGKKMPATEYLRGSKMI